MASESVFEKMLRERSFPWELIFRICSAIRLEKASTSVPRDRLRLLNLISRHPSGIDAAKPSVGHRSYAAADGHFAGRVAAAVLRRAWPRPITASPEMLRF